MSPRVASACSRLPAVREGFAVNKRVGRQRGGIIHGVTSSPMSHSVSAQGKIPLLIRREVWIATENLANTLFSYTQQFFFFRIWLLKHVAVFCHNVFQAEESRRQRMSRRPFTLDGRLPISDRPRASVQVEKPIRAGR